MKIRLLLALTGLAISHVVPAFAQQKEPTLSEQDRQQLDALGTKYALAFDKNDAAAIAVLFTEDGKLVTQAGILSGREAIEKSYQGLFKGGPMSDLVIKGVDLHGAGNMAWNVGQWSSNTGHGNWGALFERDGDTWTIRMLTINETPSMAATGAATPTQQTNKPDPQLRVKLIAAIKKHTDALDKNDATAVATCFTEDGVYVTAAGPVNGREAIEKYHADLFKQVQLSNNVVTVDADSPHIIGTDGKQMWATGAWSATVKGQNFGPTQVKGYWTVIREGDDWKIRNLTFNTTPPPAATSSPTASPSNQ